ncbi:MAG: DUF378 domain-containing protein [Faecalibacterium sp.]|nr:DUF378 domain-containing protein [Ruminococcus sp.]MCM1391646.1 DUF378 domain-containing protein [Ruminococcus sp.]MCM1485745.1 DUF378 domain-containing protein [Faecalibacterium sp.]
MLDKIALTLTIIGGINWGLVGLFRFDLVAWIFGGQTAIISRIIYTVIALASIWCISMLFQEKAVAKSTSNSNRNDEAA